jgi:uncharacterized protein
VRRWLLAAAAAVACAAVVCASAAPHPAISGSWRGTFSLPTLASISVQLSGGRATVTLPAGHPAPTRVAVWRGAHGRLRFVLPGRPTPLVFAGRLAGRTIRGTVTQAGLRGTFVLRRGQPLASGSLGVYRLDSGAPLALVQPAGRRLLVDFDASRIHGLFASGGSRWDVGSGLGTRAPATGSAVFSADRLELTQAGARQTARRIPQVEREVRFRSGSVWLAGTLAVPVGARAHTLPGVVLVHGSGPTTRNDPAVLAAYFEAQGLAVLTYDKRGIGQSAGSYPGEAATETSVGVYARDAAAAARFLAAQPEVDRSRVGLAGSSQAGWIAPPAATKEPTIRYLALVSGPAVTTGEVDTYAGLTTQGQTTPSASPAEILEQVRRAGPGGFDPLPSIRRLTVPSLWLYGALDQHVPAALCVERLAGTGADVRVFPRADHFLIESDHGLIAEDLRSHRYADGAFVALGSWLDAHGLR